MNTTLLFAELLIIGFEVFAWLFVLVLDLFGIAWMNTLNLPLIDSLEFLALLLILTFAYVLGIIFDRLVDAIFAPFDHRIRRKIFGGQDVSLVVMRYKLVKDNPHLEHQIAYVRSRLRIARATVLNMLLLAVTVIVLISTRLEGLTAPQKLRYSLLAAVFGLVLSGVSLFAWYTLTMAYSRMVKTNYADRFPDEGIQERK